LERGARLSAPLNLRIKVKGGNNMKTKSENKARCEACGKRLRRDEGKVCRVCMGKVAKLNTRIGEISKKIFKPY